MSGQNGRSAAVTGDGEGDGARHNRADARSAGPRAASMHATMLHAVRCRFHACMRAACSLLRTACMPYTALKRTTCTVRHATCAKPVCWCSHGHCMAWPWPWHGVATAWQATSVRQRFTSAAGCMLHDVRCWLRVAWFVCVCACVLRSRVGAAIGCRLAALGTRALGGHGPAPLPAA